MVPRLTLDERSTRRYTGHSVAETRAGAVPGRTGRWSGHPETVHPGIVCDGRPDRVSLVHRPVLECLSHTFDNSARAHVAGRHVEGAPMSRDVELGARLIDFRPPPPRNVPVGDGRWVTNSNISLQSLSEWWFPGSFTTLHSHRDCQRLCDCLRAAVPINMPRFA